MRKKSILVSAVFLFILVLLSLQCSAYIKSSVSGLSSGVLSGGLSSSGGQWVSDRTICEAGQDFAVQIAPFGCEPALVRSDLLEEQNVPVFCQLAATKINPLISIDAIDSISFSGQQLPKEVSGVGFFPAQAALGVQGKLNSPVLNNIGYAVIVLKKQQNESSMPDSISGNLTATLKYDLKNAYGIGDTIFYLPEISEDSVWENSKSQYSFWNERGYLRAESISFEDARISIHTSTNKLGTISLDKGQTSNEIFLPGFDCLVGVKLKLEDLTSSDTKAILKVNGDTLHLNNGEKFLENKCQVLEITKRGLTKKVEISCKEDEGTKRFELVLAPKIKIKIGNEEKEVGIGEYLYEGTQTVKVGGKDVSKKVYVYLGYIGTKGDTGKLEDSYVVLVSTPLDNGLSLSSSDISNYANRAEGIYSNIYRDKSKILGLIAQQGATTRQTGTTFISSVRSNTDLKYIPYADYDEFFNDNVFSKIQNFALSPEDRKKLISKEFAGKEIRIVDFASPVNRVFDSGEGVLNYYSSASNDYSEIIKSYAGEKDPSLEEALTKELGTDYTLGSEAISKYVVLASALNQKENIKKLCEDFNRLSSGANILSKEYQRAKEICESPIKQSSTSSSSKELVINSNQKLISLEDIREPSFEEYGAKVKISLGSEAPMYYDLLKDKTIYFDPEKGQYIQLISVDKSKNTVGVNINTSVDVIRGLYETKKQTLEKGKPSSFGTAYTYEVIEIYEKKQAKVSVTSTINRVKTDANFTFKIGIEKRAIQLSPEEIKERIEDLNETIKDIEEINDKLTKVVEGMKGACLATGLALTVKNFVNNLDGQSIARQQVMTGKGGWNEKCIELVSKKTYSNVEQCYIQEAPQIDRDVSTLTSAIKEQNSQIKLLQERCKLKGEGLFFEEIINTSCFIEAYSEKLSKDVPSSLESYTFEYDGKSVSSSKIVELIKDKKVSIEDMRAIELYSKTKSDSGLSGASNKELNSLFGGIYASYEKELNTIDIANKYGVDQNKVTTILVKDAKVYSYSGLTVGDLKEKDNSLSYLPQGTDLKSPVAIINLNGKDYVGLLEKKSNGNFYLKEDGLYLDGSLVSSIPNDFTSISFKVTNQESYSNSYKGSLGSSVSGPVLRCYTNAPYQNYPAIVPIDTTKGWYVSISQTLPIFSNMGVASYQDSGRVMSFYICNVFKNGIEENRGGDDECTMINLGTGQSIQIGGLSPADSKKLVDEAVKVVEAGQKACQTKKAGDIFNLGTNAKNIRLGTPAASTPEASCYNFMSPSDCKILFNVCDPVICPNSRCNFGGKYTVTDVIQSGIIGSVLLCLPNFVYFGGDVYIPVCLAGIKAGLDGYLSIIKAYRGCLQENLESGKTIGICDQIHSVYLCEFFWRQTLPLAKMIIPKSIELFMGQSVRGGGEYMSVQNAWTTAGNSMDYFVQYYSAEAYTAFKSKIAQEVSDSVCKNYISGAYPEGGNILDSLTQASSPPQYHGNFQEISYTTATNPPISQYKVFYHIYAGENSRAYYQVYLTDVAEGSYYQDTVTKLIVDTGYIEQGAAASETKDFTAVSGYKKLCINVNGKEECGFKQVSSSFAVDWVADQYLLDQVNQSSVTSESECVSGTASAWSLATLSAQGAASDIVNPSLYNRGVIRICANENPGKATDKDTSNPRWVSVGYCDDKNLKCWLDKESVKSAVNFDSTAQEILKTTTENFLEQMKTEGKYLTTEQFKIEISKINSAETPIAKISLINGIISKVSMNAEKGKLFLLRGDAYGELAKEAYSIEMKKEADRIAAEKAAAAAKAAEDKKKEEEKKPVTEATKTSDTREKIVAMAKELDGKSYTKNNAYSSTATEKQIIYNYDNKNNDPKNGLNCFDSVIHVYKLAGASFGGFKYCLNDGVSDIYTDNCNGFDAISKEYLESGDILSIVWPLGNGFSPHNVIFIEWTNYNEGKAKIFDWGTGTGGKFIISTVTLNFGTELTSYAVYAVGKPVISSTSAKTTTSNLEECQKEYMERIIKISKEVKDANIEKKPFLQDSIIKQDTGAKDFGNLVLAIALQESSINHFKTKKSSDCFNGDGDKTQIILGDGGKSIGIMQINLEVHPSMSEDAYSFDKNVRYAAEYLIKNYDPSSKFYNCANGGKGATYTGWKNAIRSYNGWNDCSKGNINYVEEVLDKIKNNEGNINSVASSFQSDSISL